MFRIKKRLLVFSNMAGYKRSWLRSDFMAALVVTAIAIPESLGFAVIVGLPVQAGLYCALVAPIVFAAFTSSKRLVVGADSATAALVAAGAATVAVAGTAAYGDAIAMLGIVTAVVLLAMSVLRFGFMADLISRPVLIGFISGVGVQLLIGKLPEMLGMHAHGNIVQKLGYVLTHVTSIGWPTAMLSAAVVLIVVLGWKYRYPGALLALVAAIVATKLFHLHTVGIEVIGSVPAGLPSVRMPQLSLDMALTLLPAAFSIAVVILAQSLAVIRNAAAKHEEKVNDNQDLMALGLANAASAFVGGFAINGSPPRTSAGEMAGGRSQMVNVIMAALIGVVLVVATGLFEYVPAASLAAIVFTIGLHLIKLQELQGIWRVRKSEFVIATAALVIVAIFGVQKGVMIAVMLSLMERLRRQYHPKGELLLRDQQYTEWAADRFVNSRIPLDAPKGLIAYRFNEALFFENAGYFLDQVTHVITGARKPVREFILDASAVTDVDYTAAQVISRLVSQLQADDIQLSLAHVSPHLRKLLKSYGLIDVIGSELIHPNLRFAIEAYGHTHLNSIDRIKSLNMPQDECIAIGGSALAVRGIRESKGVDLVVTEAVYDILRDKGWKEFVHDDGKRILSRNGYQIMQRWMGHDFSYFRENSEYVSGILVMGFEDLIACKTRLGRKKDVQDIALIRTLQKAEKKRTRSKQRTAIRRVQAQPAAS